MNQLPTNYCYYNIGPTLRILPYGFYPTDSTLRILPYGFYGFPCSWFAFVQPFSGYIPVFPLFFESNLRIPLFLADRDNYHDRTIHKQGDSTLKWWWFGALAHSRANAWFTQSFY
jgi:hypothetical protein